MSETCRCGHPKTAHVWWEYTGSTFAGPGGTECHCHCPEYRPAETRDTITLRGTTA